jgi:large subunit ribosomal protein L25
MADIVLNVEVRDRTGTGGARAARREGLVPGVLYGGGKDPVAVSVKSNEFRKALYSGKLVGHVVTLAHKGEKQKVIAKSIQFHPVNDQPIHFDLYRVDEHQEVKIAVPVHVNGQDVSPGLKRGGALVYAFHEVEVLAAADNVPEQLEADVSELDIGGAIHAFDLKLPNGVKLAAKEDFVVATVSGTSAQAAADDAADEAAAASASAESEAAKEE